MAVNGSNTDLLASTRCHTLVQRHHVAAETRNHRPDHEGLCCSAIARLHLLGVVDSDRRKCVFLGHYHYARSLFVLPSGETVESRRRGQMHRPTRLPSSLSRHEYGIRNAHPVATTAHHLDFESHYEATAGAHDVV